MKKVLVLGVVLGLAGLSTGATAHGHFGVMVDVRLWPMYYPGPYYHPYYPAPVVVVPATPPVYIEQPVSAVPVAPPVQVAPPAYYWYHCNRPEGYYPYVKECTGGWTKVNPQPVGQ